MIPLKTSIIVPCHNEELRLDTDEFLIFLNNFADIDILFVNDASSDGTQNKIEKLIDSAPKDRAKILNLSENRGKAEAVRRGVYKIIVERDYDLVGFWDADLATPLQEIPGFVDTFVKRPELNIVMGCRLQTLGRLVNRKMSRHYLGRIFATFASMALNLGVYDTQCGAKLFRISPEMKLIFEEPFISKWLFDVEILARMIVETSLSHINHSVFEYTLDTWINKGDSKVKVIDFMIAPLDLIQIYIKYLWPIRNR
jgi:dolichyl-phosphate beta-glucosyltransferase